MRRPGFPFRTHDRVYYMDGARAVAVQRDMVQRAPRDAKLNMWLAHGWCAVNERSYPFCVRSGR